MPELEQIRACLAARDAALLTVAGSSQAAVALVLCGHPRAPDVLFIERAERDGDPWSGHMAFPGGRREAGDASARQAAERETLEEVGLRLDSAEPLGRLDDIEGLRSSGVARLVVSSFVYHVERRLPLVLNPEVRTAFWFPLRALLEPQRHVEHALTFADRSYPGIRVGSTQRQVVWGLTLRFLHSFFEAAGQPLPRPTFAGTAAGAGGRS